MVTTPYSSEQLNQVRLSLQDQAAKRTIEDIAERVQLGADALAESARAVPESALGTLLPGEGDEEWTALDCLRHIVDWNRIVAQQVLYVALSGDLPPPGEAPVLPETVEGLLTYNAETLDSLYAHVREAEPDAYLHIRWSHPFFGDLNWREWFLFLRIHCLDHAGQLKQFKGAA